MSQLVVRIKHAGRLTMGDRVIRNPNGLEDGDIVAPDSVIVEDARTVGSVKVGTKKATIRDTEGRSLLYTTNDTWIAVLREELTEEEEAAKHEARVRKILTEALETGLRDNHPEKLLADVIEISQQRGPRGVIFRMADALLEGQAMFDFYQQVEHLYTEGSERCKGDILMSFAAVMARVLEHDRHSTRVLSRSTSLVSNVSEDLGKWAASQHLDGMLGGGDLLRRKVLELQIAR